MSYTNQILLFLPFDSLPISDAIGNSITNVGGIPVITNAVFGNGYQMEVNKSIQINGLNSLSQEFTLSFWLKSVNPGIINSTYPLVMPLMNKGSFTFISNNYSIGATSSWTIYEETQQNNQNRLKIVLGQNTTLISSSYSVNEFHHFCIIYKGSTNTFNLYIDGLQDSSTLVGSIPTSLTTNSNPIEINGSAPGLISQIADNVGILDDLAIFNTSLDAKSIQRLVNLGAAYVCDNSYINVEEIYQTIFADDPSTTQIVAVHTSRGNLFVGKTNGELLRGVRSLWESRKEFADDRELGYSTIINKDNSSTALVLDGKLVLGNQTIRI